MNSDIGKKIKELRTQNNLTLNDLSEKTNLSTGYLSQLERGLTSIAIDTLSNIGEALGVTLSYFLTEPKNKDNFILRSYERQVLEVENNKIIQFQLTNDMDNKNLLPRIFEILPSSNNEKINLYPHAGEEFVYVLEGILTLLINDKSYELFPGDSAHYNSNLYHNWANNTNKTVKILTVHTPNLFKK
ncbi:cupin domain-containing protein [Clostridium fermenticellae]|uniref:Cupin domain-containing protein n=1 Tax=Clostridium fermenticellae TaxID=2068654 RepID=A0A386H374_9CLOT|nr:cupin domain-containing protein [Clostridium fermenticellae]AYD39935.1 cupin domain-containing protein [Clostridium fermenticellae]